MAYPAGDLRSVFHDQLHGAVTAGRVPLTSLGLGPATLAALAIIALKHPDSTRSEIAIAYDTFGREHPPRRAAAPPRVADDSRWLG